MGQTADELRNDIERRRENLSGTVDAIEDRVRPGRIIERRRQAVRTRIGRTRDRVMGTGTQVSNRMSEGVDSATSTMRDVGSDLTDMPELVADQTRGAPIIAGALAFGVGALLALVLPETEAEHQVAEKVQPQISAATDAVKDAGRRAVETAQEASQGALQDLKESATEHANEVVEQAKDAGEHVKETARSSTDSN
jgi:hypothetical protein